MLKIGSVRAPIEDTALEIDFRAEWIPPYYNKDDIYVVFTGVGDRHFFNKSEQKFL